MGTRNRPLSKESFKSEIWKYYSSHRRAFPWRETKDPYKILVSEIMLQQTQVERVMHKYGRFITRFPGFSALAKADLQSVLQVWQGLGYNRRAIALKKCASRVVTDHAGELPKTVSELVRLPGIGSATAGSILAFAYNIPTPFIETNIRRVFIHFFFPERNDVKDSEILPLVEETLDREDPRQWYYALMDYGARLKSKTPNPNRRSAHYARQSPLEGSDRQIRGKILKALLSHGSTGEQALIDEMGKDPDRVRRILLAMETEGFLKRSGGLISLA
ncbi:MAG TPA: A/G-specific adenine glycosylase [Deltaproteobacteria bacterium]|nr:A/G-specific adenine glycosylase [Deltaproteobacteria bacterium]